MPSAQTSLALNNTHIHPSIHPSIDILQLSNPCLKTLISRTAKHSISITPASRRFTRASLFGSECSAKHRYSPPISTIRLFV